MYIEFINRVLVMSLIIHYTGAQLLDSILSYDTKTILKSRVWLKILTKMPYTTLI